MKIILSDSSEGKKRYAENVNFIHKDNEYFEFQFIVRYYDIVDVPELDIDGVPTGNTVQVEQIVSMLKKPVEFPQKISTVNTWVDINGHPHKKIGNQYKNLVTDTIVDESVIISTEYDYYLDILSDVTKISTFDTLATNMGISERGALAVQYLSIKQADSYGRFSD